jgi:hypothetical protein
MTSPPPATVVERRPQRDPAFSSPRPASSPIGRSEPHTTNQNGGDLYPYDDETGQSGDMWQIISYFFYIFMVFL